MSEVISLKSEFLERYIQNTLKRFEFEVSLLQKWFKENYGSYFIEIDTDFSRLRRSLFIRCRLYDHEHHRIEDRESFLKIVRIDEKSFINSHFMNQFLGVLNEQYRKEISKLISNYRHMELLEYQA